MSEREFQYNTKSLFKQQSKREVNRNTSRTKTKHKAENESYWHFSAIPVITVDYAVFISLQQQTIK
ncbi:CLUMA_CG011705, isoform A [Clunio marinus]|uniref:CLUMA_CG011705, isoform A n=1 Tax=Clunio marinus TaxID=568069 RepID=A0A1J1IDQ0_9DIPT|nr:CLUMA_CG011705, isoform A [Clunio marinus]